MSQVSVNKTSTTTPFHEGTALKIKIKSLEHFGSSCRRVSIPLCPAHITNLSSQTHHSPTIRRAPLRLRTLSYPLPHSSHQLLQSKVPPHQLPPIIHSPGDPKSGMLVWHHVILVFRVDGLILRKNVDVF